MLSFPFVYFLLRIRKFLSIDNEHLCIVSWKFIHFIFHYHHDHRSIMTIVLYLGLAPAPEIWINLNKQYQRVSVWGLLSFPFPLLLKLDHWQMRWCCWYLLKPTYTHILLKRTLISDHIRLRVLSEDEINFFQYSSICHSADIYSWFDDCKFPSIDIVICVTDRQCHEKRKLIKRRRSKNGRDAMKHQG